MCIRLISASSSFGKQNAVPVSLQAGGGIPCRPNPAATLLVLLTSPTRWNRKLGQDWIGHWHLVQLLEFDRALWSLLRLNSTQLDTQPNVQNHRTCHKWISWVELSSKVVITAPDQTQLNQLSWIELSPVRRCDQGFTEKTSWRKQNTLHVTNTKQRFTAEELTKQPHKLLWITKILHEKVSIGRNV